MVSQPATSASSGNRDCHAARGNAALPDVDVEVRQQPGVVGRIDVQRDVAEGFARLEDEARWIE